MTDTAKQSNDDRQKDWKEYQTFIKEQNSRGEIHVTFEKFMKDRNHQKFLNRLTNLLEEIKLGKNFEVFFEQDREIKDGRMYFQIRFLRPDIITGIEEWGYGGKAYLSPHMTRNELVQTVFGLYKSFWEHEARETFTYRGRCVFGLHMDVDEVWKVSRKVDVRSAQHKEAHGGKND